MSIGNQEIERNVGLIIGAYLKGVKTRPEDEPIIKAGAELVINLLHNMNDIAYYMSNADARADR